MKAPHGKIVVSIVANDDGELQGIHLLRFDGASACVRLPDEFGTDFGKAYADLADPEFVASVLARTAADLHEAEFKSGSPLARRAEESGSDPVKAGDVRHYGMGYLGFDVGEIDAAPSDVGR